MTVAGNGAETGSFLVVPDYLYIFETIETIAFGLQLVIRRLQPIFVMQNTYRKNAALSAISKTYSPSRFQGIKNDSVINTIVSITESDLVAGEGFEPTTFGL